MQCEAPSCDYDHSLRYEMYLPACLVDAFRCEDENFYAMENRRLDAAATANVHYFQRSFFRRYLQ
jgi:hypothetical protein